jgi:cell division protein FtsW
MRLRMDWVLFGTILAMLSFGLVMVYSASSVTQELKKNAKAATVAAQNKGAAADTIPAPSEPPSGEGAPILFPFGFSIRRLAAALLGVAALRFFWRNYRSGVFTRPWAILGASLVLFLQVLAYWMDSEKSPHWALLVRQGGAALAGFFLMMYLSHRDYRQFRSAQWAFTALGSVIFLLIVVYFADEKHRWLRVGLSIQPSELAKPALVLFLAWFVTLRRSAINHPATIWPAALSLVVLAGAVMIPDVGTAVVLIATAAAMFYLAGLNWRYTTAALGIGLLFLGLAIVYKPYRLKRVIQFADPEYTRLSYLDPGHWLQKRADQAVLVSDTRYHALQSEIAVGTGGITGRGIGESRQKLMFLPEAHNDYIFAIIAEELGLLGSTFVLAGFMIVLWRGYRLFWTASDDFGRYLAVGISTLLVFQALLNMSVVLDLFPTKGIPLPLISFGGTSMVSSMVLLGLLLSVSQRSST